MTRIEYLRLTNRTYNTLLHNGIETVEDLQQRGWEKLHLIGDISKEEIRKAIAAFQTKA